MSLNDLAWSRSDVERLMNFSALAMELTGSLHDCLTIPDRLSATLGVKPLSLAIVEHDPSQLEPKFLCLAASGSIAAGDNAAPFQNHILDIYRHVRTSAARDSAALRHTFDIPASNTGFTQTACADPLFPRQLVLARSLTPAARLLLVLHLRADQMLPSGIITESLTLIADQLAKLLRTHLAWQESPASLGHQFERLTEREWSVLLGLKSDDGEKQLADKLGLSPHTLHSHIKAIYRKVNVQGRLPLLLKLESVIRDRRLHAVSNPPLTEDAPDRAVAS